MAVDTTDSLGQPLRVYQGQVDLELGGTTGRVQVFRAPRFPVLEELSLLLGVEIHGLLGLSAMRALYVDGAGGVLRVERAMLP